MKPCLDALQQNPAKWERLRSCVWARMSVLPVLQEHGPASKEVKAAVYSYLAQSAGRCRLQHSMSWVQEANQQARRASQGHMQLIHRVLPSLPLPGLYHFPSLASLPFLTSHRLMHLFHWVLASLFFPGSQVVFLLLALSNFSSPIWPS